MPGSKSDAAEGQKGRRAEGQKNYYRDFDVVEIQETFYQPGRIEKYEKRRYDAPAGFEFAVKAWQLITHEASSPRIKS
jgi:uncharacterized protein YecE (DUF72 family)